MVTILIGLAVLMLPGAVLAWRHSRNWGYGPSGGLGVVVIVDPGRRSWRSAFLILLAVGALASSACASMTVNQILADPSRYRNQEVRVSGAVVDSYSLANRGAYRIDDGTGQLWIVSETGVPRRSARVTVKGRVREGFNLGPLADRINLPSGVGAGLILMESSHKAKN